MKPSQLHVWCILFLILSEKFFQATAADLPAATISSFVQTNGQATLAWEPYPAAQSYRIRSARNPADPFLEDLSGIQSNFSWTATTPYPYAFYQLEVEPLPDSVLLAANALNRLAYGPTPDEWERLTGGPSPLGGQGYINEQLAIDRIPDALDTEPVRSGWQFSSFTGTAGVGRLYIYLDGPGTVYVDDVQVVKGDSPEVGPNLLKNGDFETALSPNWQVTANFASSTTSIDFAHKGNSSLKLVATAAGSGGGNSVFQNFTPFSASQVYTFSFYYLPADSSAKITVRMSGNSTAPSLNVRPTAPPISDAYSKLSTGKANLPDLRAWLVLRAVDSPRQLLEVLTQFFENHFVTEHSKTVDYLDRFYDDSAKLDVLATSLEWREVSRWRTALGNPQGTFHDLLKISAESPAQIIFLDTVGSRGDGKNIANENYSRELLELYTFGVDNGYDQNDITTMSRAWTGWSVRLVDEAEINNPFAATSTNRIDNTITNATLTAVSNLVGVWTYTFRADRHNTNSKTIFPGQTVPSRFGSPWAGRNYELKLPARAGTNGIQDGQSILKHLADQPFTQEFISVKLCRLFVHEDFVHGTYDYSKPDELSPEGKLILECMNTWENGNPKGQIREVLKTIFNSELFQKHGSSMHKVKTPLEYCASAIRALRGKIFAEKYGASTDGYSISGRSRTASSSPLVRMGVMRLFDRAEPDGYTEAAPGWISAGTLAERIRFIQTFLMPTSESLKADAISGGNFNLSDPTGLAKAHLPSAQWSQASAIADYFLGILFPAEGAANLSSHREAAIEFLNTSDDASTSSPFALLDPSSSAYDNRVRAVVAMLMISPRFQEQ